MFRRSSLTDRALPERSKSWAGNVIAQQLTDFSGKKLPESKLPEHRLKKKTEHGEVQDFVWAKTDMTGWRVTMEDADCCTPNLPEPLSGNLTPTLAGSAIANAGMVSVKTI